MIVFVLFILGLLFLAGSIALPEFVPTINPFVQGGLGLIGLALMVTAAYFAMYRAFYKIAKPNEAIIRTGGFGRQATAKPVVAIKRGIWVIPLIHEHKKLLFKQFVLQVSKTDALALVCKDMLLANVKATFKVAVNAEEEDVLKYLDAAGDRDLNDLGSVMTLVIDTVETALRDACTAKTYDEVFQGREQVGNEIENSVTDDFTQSGLKLVSAKLTDVDPTPEPFYDPQNPQHAVGLRVIVDRTEDQRLAVETKRFQTQKAVEAQRVDKEKRMLALKQDEEFAESDKARAVRERRALDEQAAEEAELAKQEAVLQREIAQQLAVERDTVAKERQVAVDREQQEQAQIEARIAKEKAEELADEEKKLALEAKQQERAKAETERVTAETELEEARQKRLTVEKTETAAREAEVEYIKAEKKAAEARKVAEEEAEAEAFTVERGAEARQKAATSEAAAVTTAAEAERTAALARAQGDEAEKMVDVKVHDEEVTVLERELKAKQENQEAAIGLEVQLTTIKEEAKVRMAFAQAMPQLLQGASIDLVGTPDMLESTLSGITRAMGLSALVNGTVNGVSEEAKDLAIAGVQGIGGMLKSLIAGITGGGGEITPEAIAEALDKPEVRAMLAAALPTLLSPI